MSLGRGPKLVNKQFNSPINLYSPENVAEALSKQSRILANGAVGIDFHQLAAPNLANSAVLRMLEEEERQRGGKEETKPDKRRRRCAVEWPPKDDIKKRIHGLPDVENYGHSFFSTFYLERLPGLRRVAWPPPPEDEDKIVSEPVFTKAPDSFGNVTASQEPNSWASSVPSSRAETYYQPPPAPQFEPPPATIVLRPEAPISQAPNPVFTSQPAATKAVGPKMRGDEKWPPSSYKAQAEAENEARRALAKGPAVRPRRVRKDYSSFFAQNALQPNYPTYRAPPGTQHYIEEGTSNF